MSKPVTILYFAWLREQIGVSRQEMPLPDDVTTVGKLLDWLMRTSVLHAKAFAPDRKIRCAVNQEFAGPDTPVAPGDEIGFFPPVTGG